MTFKYAVTDDPSMNVEGLNEVVTKGGVIKVMEGCSVTVFWEDDEGNLIATSSRGNAEMEKPRYPWWYIALGTVANILHVIVLFAIFKYLT